MKNNQCHSCYRFARYEDMDSYTPFGSNYDKAGNPIPLDGINLCKKCSQELKEEFLRKFKEGNYNCGDWQKSSAERQAAKELNLIWVGGGGVEYKGKRVSFQYVPAEIYKQQVGNLIINLQTMWK